MRKLVFLISCLVYFNTTTIVAATTFFVSPAGNDSNNGSEATPFKTISKGISVVQAGDTLEVASGIYSNFSVSKSGDAGYPITIRGNNSIITNVQTAINLSGSYLKVSGFEVSNTTSHAVLISGKNITFSDFIIHNSVLENMGSNDSCSGSGGWGSGLKVMLGGENITLQNGKIYQNCGEGLGITRAKNILIRNLVAYDNFSVNYYLDNSINVVLENSLSYCTSDARYYRNNNPAAGILIGEESYTGWGAQLINLTIKNNIISGCAPLSFYGAEVSPGGLKGANISNNTLHNLKTTSGRGIHIATEIDNRDIIITNNIAGGTVTTASFITSSNNLATTTYNQSPNPTNPMTFIHNNPGVGADPLLFNNSTSSTTPTPTSSPSPSISPTPKPGDLYVDGKIDILDFNELITHFGTKYTIIDFNLIITNFGT